MAHESAVEADTANSLRPYTQRSRSFDLIAFSCEVASLLSTGLLPFHTAAFW